MLTYVYYPCFLFPSLILMNAPNTRVFCLVFFFKLISIFIFFHKKITKSLNFGQYFYQLTPHLSLLPANSAEAGVGQRAGLSEGEAEVDGGAAEGEPEERDSDTSQADGNTQTHTDVVQSLVFLHGSVIH